jgi:tripartite-type tricarboxylate transporter receptor subunit TctC
MMSSYLRHNEAILVSRRRFLQVSAGAAALSAVPHAASAQVYPSRPITMIVPFAPGGGTDVAARIVGEHMGRTLGQQIVIQNIAGAGGTIGSTRAMRAEHDGYTLLMGQMGTHATAVALYPNLAYRPDADFAPIGLVCDAPEMVVARKDFSPKDFAEFISFVKANADKLNVGHAGVGSIFFSTCLMLNSILNVKPTMVAFNGGAPAMNTLVAGQIDYMCADIVTAAPQLQAGTIKAYAIASAARHPAIPTVPTSDEAGLPEFHVSGWFALFAPQATPKPILDKLTDALDRALDNETTRKRLLELGNDVPEKPRRGQQALRTLLGSEIRRWTAIIQAAKVKAE